MAATPPVRMAPLRPEVAADPRLRKVFAVVESNRNEDNLLWRMHAQEAHRHGLHLGDQHRVEWVQDTSGLFIQVGTYAGKPVSMSLSFATLNGKLVVFFDPTSTLVCHDMIDTWLAEHIAPRGDVLRTDAANFHVVLHAVAVPQAA